MKQQHKITRIAALFLALAIAASSGWASVNPAPFINDISPVAALPGASAFTLTVNGTGYVSGAVVKWKVGTTTTALTTTFVSATQLTAEVPASLVTAAGTASVTVVNPSTAPASNVEFFQITAPTSGVAFSTASTPGVGNSPESVAAGDFNGDGKLDLAVANFVDSNVSILLGNGDGTFTAAAKSPVGVGNSPESVAVGDFNGDGKLDLAVANFGDNTVSILLGNGDGTFTAKSPVGVGNSPESVAVGDFNGDGKLDLAVANIFNGNGGNSVSILLGNGDGTFTAATGSPVAVGNHPASVAVGDFNGDGKLDLAVANEFDNTVSILLGAGDGTFTAATGSPIGVGNAPDSVAAGDFNGDGKLDLATANGVDNTVSILLGKGDGTFSLKSSPGVGNSPNSLAVADFNGDGKLDLAVANFSNSVSILLGNGDGTFTPGSAPGVGSDPVSVAVGDFNGDGRLDIASANGNSKNVTVLVQEPFALSPSNGLSFGNQNVGSSSSTQSVTLSAGLAVDITSIEVSAGSTNFQLLTTGSSCPYSGGALGAGANCTVDLQFAPTAVGPLTGTVTVTGHSGGAADSTQTISLTGTGVGIPSASVSPSSLSFGNQPLGTTSAAQTVTLSNTGSAALTISYITLSNSSTSIARNFSISSNNCGSPLAQNSSCQIGITFTPQSTGALTGSLTFIDNSLNVSNAMQSIGLSGTGTIAPTITQNATNQAVPAGQTAIFTAAASGFPAPTVQWQVSVNGGAFTNIPGATSTTLSFRTNDSMTGNQYRAVFTNSLGTAPTTATLTVEDYTITATPASQTIQAGHSATYSINLASVRGLSGNVALTCSGGPPNSKCTINPNTVALNGTATVTLTPIPLMSVNPGTFTLKFTGSLDGITHSTNVTLTIKCVDTTRLSSSKNPSTVGDQVTLIAIVVPPPGCSGTPTGSVTFYDGLNPLGTSALDNGAATIGITFSAPGSHFIAAKYNGDSSFFTSISPALTQVVLSPAR